MLKIIDLFPRSLQVPALFSGLPCKYRWDSSPALTAGGSEGSDDSSEIWSVEPLYKEEDDYAIIMIQDFPEFQLNRPVQPEQLPFPFLTDQRKEPIGRGMTALRLLSPGFFLYVEPLILHQRRLMEGKYPNFDVKDRLVLQTLDWYYTTVEQIAAILDSYEDHRSGHQTRRQILDHAEQEVLPAFEAFLRVHFHTHVLELPDTPEELVWEPEENWVPLTPELTERVKARMFNRA